MQDMKQKATNEQQEQKKPSKQANRTQTAERWLSEAKGWGRMKRAKHTLIEGDWSWGGPQVIY